MHPFDPAALALERKIVNKARANTSASLLTEELTTLSQKYAGKESTPAFLEEIRCAVERFSAHMRAGGYVVPLVTISVIDGVPHFQVDYLDDKVSV